ncbi:MAG: hypothetical protein QM784_19170 [Polyangiaceae bacterium]
MTSAIPHGTLIYLKAPPKKHVKTSDSLGQGGYFPRLPIAIASCASRVRAPLRR